MAGPNRKLEKKIEELERKINHPSDKLAALKETYRLLVEMRDQTCSSAKDNPDSLFLGSKFPTEEEFIRERIHKPLTL